MTNQSDFSKEQLDIAFANQALGSGAVSERELATALATWTIHGSKSLSDHLVERDLIDSPTRDQVEQLAKHTLRTCKNEIAASSQTGNASGTDLIKTLAVLDQPGTVARLLGIRTARGTEDSLDAHRATRIKFKLIRKLGQGGLGRVWLALDENMNRHVALKEITATHNALAVERFRREAEITGRLEHPGIVPVYELGVDEKTGEPFYAMRFLGKQTLHDAILEYHERRADGDDNPMLIRELLTAFVSVCQAVGHAHSRKVIHRDLKPENVAIDSFGQVIVIDWGLAKVIDEVGLGHELGNAQTTGSGLGSTIDGQVLGTPLYMAPEQAAGRIDDLDEKTDIYGLGAILFAILTGHAPHEHTRASAQSTNTRDLISAITSQDSPRAGTMNSEVDLALEAICYRAMAKRQYARYQTASQLAEDVQRWMAGEPVSAYQERPTQRIARWVSSHRIWSQVIAGLVIVSIVALATLGIASRQSYIAQRHIQFDAMTSMKHELEVQLVAVAEDLAQDVRFVSTLPPIQGIITSRSGVDVAESEEVWRGRLETISEGLLRANPDYSAVVFAAVEPIADSTPEAEDGATRPSFTSEDIARVERAAGESGTVRRVPPTRLGQVERDKLVQRAATLAPGQVMLILRDDMANSRSVQLIAAMPVFDDTSGRLFGIVGIRSNLTRQVATMIDRLDARHAQVIVTDNQGVIWLSADPVDGVSIPSKVTNVGDEISVLGSFLKDPELRELLDERTGVIAQRTRLDEFDAETNVIVLLRLLD